MNFLNGGYPGIYRRINCLKANCCRVFKPQYLNDNVKRIINCNKSKTPQFLLHSSEPCLSANMVLWTQVRYQKDCPRLHRDIEHPNFDAYRKSQFTDLKKTSWGSGDEKPGYTYVVGFFGLLCGMYGLKGELIHYLTYMSAAADVLALASIEVDISNVVPGACVSYKWRGKPLFIKHRTDVDIASEANTPMSALRDPETPEQRTVKPEWLIVIGICTHLGCVPVPNSGDWPGGFYCPCHGSHYDNVGRTRKGPAPLNLEVPPHKFISDTLVLVG